MSRAQFVCMYKLVIVGEGGVGKSALTVQFLRGRFLEDYDPTVEDCYKMQCIIDNEVADLDILDTAGQDEFVAMREHYMKHGEGFMLVYSITSRDSFEEISRLHEQLVRVKSQGYVPIALVGNKCDLEYHRQVSMNEGRSLAKQLGCQFLETSAKERFNVDEAFVTLVREIRNYNRSQQMARALNSPERQPPEVVEPTNNELCCGCVVA